MEFGIGRVLSIFESILSRLEFGCSCVAGGFAPLSEKRPGYRASWKKFFPAPLSSKEPPRFPSWPSPLQFSFSSLWPTPHLLVPVSWKIPPLARPSAASGEAMFFQVLPAPIQARNPSGDFNLAKMEGGGKRKVFLTGGKGWRFLNRTNFRLLTYANI